MQPEDTRPSREPTEPAGRIQAVVVTEDATPASLETGVPQEPVTHAPGEEPQIHLSPQSIWPISTAAGITIAGLGLVTLPIVSILGLIIMFLSIVYWVQELRHEPHAPH